MVIRFASLDYFNDSNSEDEYHPRTLDIEPITMKRLNSGVHWKISSVIRNIIFE